MIITDNMRPISGVLKLTAYNRHGQKLWEKSDHNQIVVGAYAITAEALAGVEAAKIAKVAAGTNGTAPAETDDQITDPTIVDIQTIEYPRPGVARFNFTFGYYDAAGKAICEFGLLTTDGRLFARKVRTPIDKSKYMSIVGAWEITI